MLGLLLHAPRGPFYSPKAARSRWRSNWKAIHAFCRVVHRTVRCTTGHEQFMSGARSPSLSGKADRRAFGPPGAPDTVRCDQVTVGSGHMSPIDHAADHWWRAPLAHRTVRWFLAEAPSAFSWERRVRHRARLGTEHCPVHHRLVQVWLLLAMLL
jgi:hypothetical protein